MHTKEIEALCKARLQSYAQEIARVQAAKKSKELERQRLKMRKIRSDPKRNSEYRAHELKALQTKRANKGKKSDYIAVLDFETDQFDADNPDKLIQPFTCCIYAPQFGYQVFWNNDADALIDEICAWLHDLPNSYVIYAHSGGRFDWQFFLKRMRGEILYVGNSIIDAKLEGHTLRDSYKLIPAPLAAIKKDKFDYNKMDVKVRDKHRDEIVKYMMADCEYLYHNVIAFIKEFGFVLTIGQAAIKRCKSVSKFKPISEETDAKLREYFIGGRTECIRGAGRFTASGNEVYKTYDINSAYPRAMAFCQHPGVSFPFWRQRGEPSENTFFLKIRCKNDRALLGYNDEGKLTSRIKEGIFNTTIHEYRTALAYGRIKDVEFLEMVDYEDNQNFYAFIMPLYMEREQLKRYLIEHPKDEEALRRSLFLKLMMNNAYGKYAQDARRFRACWMSDAGTRPKDTEGPGQGLWGDRGNGLAQPDVETCDYYQWSRPNPGRHFNNVGIAASITGATRAQLMEAIFKATDPIYCDTDSITCKELSGVEIDDSKLGAWSLEATFNDILISSKKMYACRTVIDGHQQGKIKIRHKGISRKRGLTWLNFEDMVLHDALIPTINFAPSFSRDGKQEYKRRNVRRGEPLYADGISAQPFTKYEAQ
jgi:DNA polymerase type B, organellar and viral